MRRCLIAFALLAVGLPAPQGASAQQPAAASSIPRPLPGNPAPEYPDDAQAFGSEGIVRFRVDVDAAGAATAVTIVDSPRAGSLAVATREAVRSWRFTPGVKEGRAAAGVYEGQVEFLLDGEVPNARMYRGSSSEAWAAVQRIFADARIKIATRDEKHHHLESAWIARDAALAPNSKTMGLPPPWRLRRYRLMAFVSPWVEPARIYLGSIVEVELEPAAAALKRPANEPTQSRLYNLDQPREWFFDRLEAVVGPLQRVPVSAIKRKRLAEDLGGSNPGCLGERLTATRPPGPGSVKPPEKFFTSVPLYPANVVNRRDTGQIGLEVWILEDGGTMPVRVIQRPGRSDEMLLAASSAISLWRYSPAIINGCPVPTVMKVTTSFNLR